MKKLLLITILIGGCATTPPQFQTTAVEREGKCKIDYRDQYWGDCYMRAAKADPNFSKVRFRSFILADRRFSTIFSSIEVFKTSSSYL